jgi:NAD(P)-dependent dehydrogenase (short-subunit alcohol dehydrogenase family)
MTGKLLGKIAIVTGAGSGIGKGMARRFAAEGASVVVADLSGEETTVADGLDANSMPFSVDVADPASVAALIEATIVRYGRLDIVCNNAGRSGGLIPLHETPLETWDAVMNVNLRGAFIVLQKSICEMLKNGGGAIVNTASIASFQAVPGAASYTSSKGGLMAMTRAAAVEYADRNIRVNALCPGAIATPMGKAALATLNDIVLPRIPMKRLGTVEEIASVALFVTGARPPRHVPLSTVTPRRRAVASSIL